MEVKGLVQGFERLVDDSQPEAVAANSRGCSDAIFMSSRNAVHWKRQLDAFIRPGTKIRNWSHRSNTPAWGLLATAPDEISLFVQRHYTFPTNYLERMVIRTDGFMSVHAGVSGGELITRPLTFTGENLALNFATSAAGSIRLESGFRRYFEPAPDFRAIQRDVV